MDIIVEGRETGNLNDEKTQRKLLLREIPRVYRKLYSGESGGGAANRPSYAFMVFLDKLQK
jgi:hypothetical protein